MKLRFFTLIGRQPAPGTIVSLRLHFDGKVSSEGGAREHFETSANKPEDSPVLEFIAEVSKIDGGLLIATSRTDHMGYGRIDFGSLSDGYRNMVLMLLAFGLASRQVKLVLEIEGSAASAIDILDVRSLYALFYARQEFKAALSLQNAADIVVTLLDFLSGTDDALYLQADESSATGPVGHVDDPDQTDYELSPESFVSRRPIKTGEGNGCENLTPASLPLRQYSMYHVVVHDVVVHDVAASEDDVKANTPSVNGMPPLDHRILWGEILEFEQEWKSLGHSLGEVKYSLALAPGEAIKIAVIDWQRTDAGSRLGANASADKLTHDQTVDRDIDDIVKGRVTEQQSGSTFMAGLAGAMDFQIPQYGISAAGRHSIGYGTSNTEGNRDVSADAHQNVHLETLQRSNLVRSQNSSVIVQATQAESNYLSTRIVANMNRGHSLSILYYEVLRHLAVTTKFLRADPAILVPVEMFAFDANLARRFRAQLEPVLLDAKYGAGFDALERLIIGTPAYAVPSAFSPAINSGGQVEQMEITGLRCTVKMGPNEKPLTSPGPDTPGRVSINIIMKDGSTRGVIQKNDGAPNLFLNLRNSDGSLRGTVSAGYTTYIEEMAVRLDPEQVNKLTLRFTPSSNVLEDVNSGWDVESILVEGKFDEKWVTLFAWNDLPKFSIPERLGLPARNITFPRRSDIVDGLVMTPANVRSLNQLMGTPVNISDNITLDDASRVSAAYGSSGLAHETSSIVWTRPIKSGAPDSGDASRDGSNIARETKAIPTIEGDKVIADLLVNHLNSNQYYYNSYVWLLMDPRERRQRISDYVGNLLAGMSDAPLAMSGNHLAFRYTGSNLPTAAREALPDAIAKLKPKESIVTLPTRGIFAEAHIGHCNAAEKRDITRLWNFDELPVSLLPNIETLTAGPRGAYQGLTPDAMGSSPLGIQGTPDLPAPGEAIAKALELLAKPDIFRDQSTREQVAEIMGKLIESAQPPKLTGAGVGSAWGGGQSAMPATGSGSGGGTASSPGEWANPFPNRASEGFDGQSFLAERYGSGRSTDETDRLRLAPELAQKLFDIGMTQESVEDIIGKYIKGTTGKVSSKPDAKKLERFPVTLDSSSTLTGGAAHSLDGYVFLTFYPATNIASQMPISIEFGVQEGVDTRTLSIPAGTYAVRARYRPASSDNIKFVEQPQMGSIGVNLEVLPRLIIDLMQQDLADEGGVSAPIRGTTVTIPAGCKGLSFELALKMANNQYTTVHFDAGFNEGVSIAYDGSVGFDTSKLADLAKKVAGLIKVKQVGLLTLLLSLFSLKGNVGIDGKLTTSSSGKAEFDFRAAFIQDFLIREVK